GYDFAMKTFRLFIVATLVAFIPLIASAQTKVVRFGKLWDGTKVITNAVVTVRDNRIIAVGSGDAAVPVDGEVIDLRKYTGLPGLIDLHTHITYYWDRAPGTNPRRQ